MLIVLSLLVFFLPLPYIDIAGFNEARDALRLQQLMETPHNGERMWLFPSLRKPPLFYWTGGIISKLGRSEIDEVFVRFPSALFASCGVVIVFWLGRQAVTDKGGMLAAFILLTSPLYVEQGRMGRPDMTLCFFVTVSLLLFFVASRPFAREGRLTTWSPYLFAACLACALLSKGPVGVILVLLTVGGFSAWQRNLSAVRRFLQPGPVCTFLLPGLGWYLAAVWWQGALFWQTQIAEENVSRFFGGIDSMSPLYYADDLFLRFAPWSLLLPFALWQAVRKQEEGPVFLAVWWSAVVLFFHIAAYKRAHYLLPAFPAAALLVGWWLSTQLTWLTEQLQHSSSWSWRRPLLLSLSLGMGLCIAAGYLVVSGTQADSQALCCLPLAAGLHSSPVQAALYCGWLSEHVWSGLAVWTLLSSLLLGSLHALARICLDRAVWCCIFALVLIYGAVQPSWLAAESWARSPKAFARRIVETLKGEQHVFLVTPLDYTWDGGVPVLFYIRKERLLTEITWPPGQPPADLLSGYYLVPETRWPEIVSASPGEWRVVLQDTGPHARPLVLLLYHPPRRHTGQTVPLG